jgi:hypothetical protein
MAKHKKGDSVRYNSKGAFPQIYDKLACFTTNRSIQDDAKKNAKNATKNNENTSGNTGDGTENTGVITAVITEATVIDGITYPATEVDALYEVRR